MKTIMLSSNTLRNLYNFRGELINQLVNSKYKVILVVPFIGCKEEERTELEAKGCILCDTPMNQLGTNLYEDAKLLFCYLKLLKKWKPDIVVTYTIKPNIYYGMACRLKKTPYMSNVTGLGRALENKGWVKYLAIMLFQVGLKKSKMVFFQNESNRSYMVNNKVVKQNSMLVAGSGVDLNKFSYLEYEEKETMDFLMIARVIQVKGIEEYLVAAKALSNKYSNIRFHICGFCEPEYSDIIEEYNNKGFIYYHGEVKDLLPYYQMADCVVLPSYTEGMSNALLEGAACGRAVIASNIEGCRETFEEAVSGFGTNCQDSQDLIRVIEQFILLPRDKKIQMGIEGRKKMEQEFSRKLVTKIYMEQIAKVIEEEANE